MLRPHVVILGAGASIAAIPKGDKNGKKLSVMNNFIRNLNLEDLFYGLNLKTRDSNLENIYSELYEDSKYDSVRLELEQRIYAYFSDIELPDIPTVYDFLILGLTGKDLIMTFNWDPLLLQAYKRIQSLGIKKLPHLAFLHGNVMVGFCDCNAEIKEDM